VACFKIRFQNLPQLTEENHKKTYSKISRYPTSGSGFQNWTPEHKAIVLMVYHLSLTYSIGARFESLPRHRLHLPDILWIASTPLKKVRSIPKVDHDRFRPYPHQYITH
jgi:hypothetical protein